MSFGGHLTLDFHPPGSDDLAFWADLAATFRDKFGDMVRCPALEFCPALESCTGDQPIAST